MKMKKSVINWIALVGKIKSGEDNVTHIPTFIDDGPNKGQPQFSLVKSNVEFESGKIEFYVTFKDPNSKCQLILSHGEPSETFVGLNFGSTAFGISNFSGGKWDYIAATGDLSSLQINKRMKVVILIQGSKIELYVNEVKVCSGLAQIVRAQLAFYIYGTKEVLVDNFKIDKSAPKAFVVMQFSPEYNE